jgi:hypothetical protein
MLIAVPPAVLKGVEETALKIKAKALRRGGSIIAKMAAE